MLEITQKIKELAEGLTSDSTFVVDVEIKGQINNRTVWVYLDGDSAGVSLDECSNVSRELSVLLDAHDIIEGKYVLNVSSPGLDRPLNSLRQFPKNVGRKCKVTFISEDTKQTLTGTFAGLENERVTVQTPEKKVLQSILIQLLLFLCCLLGNTNQSEPGV